MNKEKLITCFYQAEKNKAKFIGLAIRVPDADQPEVIINPYENFDVKLDYYQKTYDEDLSHNAVGDFLRIVGFTYGDSFSDIESYLLKGGEKNEQDYKSESTKE